MSRSSPYRFAGLGIVALLVGATPTSLVFAGERDSSTPPDSRPPPDLPSVSAEALDLAKLCARRKLYANAIDLYSGLIGGPVDDEARDALDKLLDSRGAVEAVLESGVDVALREIPTPEYAETPERGFEDAWEYKSDNYTVVTNIGERFARDVAAAMEQMNRSYRKVFQFKQRGGGTARCTIRVYATRDGFERHEGERKKTLKGFYSHSQHLVATYDPRADGRGFEHLWSTLFHEASHQFTRSISTGVIPGWLNEGTASYFEGARLLPTGRVAVNGIPESRLRALVAGFEEGGPSLREVISYFEPGSYHVSYYPVGWGLVYFLHNYEDERSQRVYLPLYQKYLKTYKSGGKHDPVERFEAYFVTKAKQPGVTDLDEFDARFRAWITDLYQHWRGGLDGQSKLLAKARRQRDDGALEAAAESYAWLVENGSEHADVWVEQAEVLTELKREDAALLAYRRAFAVAEGDLRDDIVARMARLDRTVGSSLPSMAQALAAASLAASDDLADVGDFERAAAVLDRALRVVGPDPELKRCWAKLEKRAKNARPTDGKLAAGS